MNVPTPTPGLNGSPPPPVPSPLVVSSVPPNAKGWRQVPTRYYVALLVALTTMLTSATAFLRPNETSARKSYDLLSKALEAEAKSNAQNHDDIVALRGYLEGYVKSRELPHSLAVESATPPPDRPHAAVPPPQTVVKVTPVEKPPPPPPLGTTSPPPRFHPPAYEQVTGKGDLPL